MSSEISSQPASFLDHDSISGNYFFPRRDVMDGLQQVEIPGARLDYYLHDSGSDLTLLHLHGNGEVIADYFNGNQSPFGTLPCNVLFLEYRGYGASTDSPALVKMLGDATAALEKLAIDPARTIAFGRSIGSIYAIELAARHSLAGLVLESGIADVAERLMNYADLGSAGIDEAQLRDEVHQRLNHRRKLGKYEGPALLLHTEHDQMVEIAHAEQNLAWIAGHDKRLVRFPAGDHNSIMFYNETLYFEELGRFVQSL